VFADGVEEAGDQQVAGGLRTGEEAGEELAGAALFEFFARESRSIEEGAIRFAAGEEAFFVQAIERGHDGGVGQRSLESLGNFVDVRFPGFPEDGHDRGLERAEDRGCQLPFPETEHQMRF